MLFVPVAAILQQRGHRQRHGGQLPQIAVEPVGHLLGQRVVQLLLGREDLPVRGVGPRPAPARAGGCRPKTTVKTTISGQRGHGDQGRPAGMRPAPSPAALDGPDRPGMDRLAGQKSLQVFGQLPGAGIAAARLLGQAFQADRLQVARRLGLPLPGRDRLLR